MKKILTIGLMALGFGASAQITVSEGFEATAFPPPGWSTPSTGNFSRNTTAGNYCVGTAAARRNIYGSGSYQSSYMMYSSTSSNGNAIDVSFQYTTKAYSSSSVVDGNLQVQYSADGGTTWGTVGSVVPLTGEVTCSTFTGTIPSGAIPTGSNFRFRITGNNTTTNSSSDWYLSLDDIKLTQIASCYTALSFQTTSLTANSVSLSWTAPATAPANGYEIYYSTTNTPPAANAVPQLTNITGTTATATGLQPDTMYYFWIRGKCSGTDVSAWNTTTGYTGACIPVNSASNFVKSFVTTGALTNINYSATSFTSWVNNFATSFVEVAPGGTFNYTITPNSSTNYFYIWVDWNNDLDFTDAGETVLATTSYTSSSSGTYTVPASVNPGTYRMRVANSSIGAATPCGPSSYGNHVDFALKVMVPSCWSPAAATVTNVTPNSALVNWTAPATVPANGYDIYYNTTNTPPTPTTVPQLLAVTGTSATINNLTPSTSYYAWIRGNCGSSNVGSWVAVPVFRTACQVPNLSLTGATVCLNGSATLSGTTDAGATIKWYADATSTTPLGTGATYTTPPLTSTTTYYASASSGETYSLGKAAIESSASGTGGGISSYLQFNAISDFTLKTVDIYPYSSTAGTAGTITIALKDASGVVLMTKTVNTIGYNSATNAVAQTVNLDFPISGGQTYRLGVSGWSGTTNMFRDSSGLNYPYTVNNVAEITGTDLGNSYYYFFYNWQISTECPSARQPVTATVDTSCLSTSEVNMKDVTRVYPNPFVDVINITNANDVKSALLLDASGRVVKNIDKIAPQISLGDVQSGLYVLSLEMKDGTKQSFKLIKK